MTKILRVFDRLTNKNPYHGKAQDVKDATALLNQGLDLINRIAHLNPKAGEIGAGMLAQLVEEANAIIKQVEVE